MSLAKSAGNRGEVVTIGFGFISDWMKKWREFLNQSCNLVDAKPVTFLHSNENCSSPNTYKINVSSPFPLAIMENGKMQTYVRGGEGQNTHGMSSVFQPF